MHVTIWWPRSWVGPFNVQCRADFRQKDASVKPCLVSGRSWLIVSLLGDGRLPTSALNMMRKPEKKLIDFLAATCTVGYAKHVARKGNIRIGIAV